MKCPENACCKLNTTDDCLKTELRADAICEKLNTDPLLQAVLSNDPGRYAKVTCKAYFHWIKLFQVLMRIYLLRVSNPRQEKDVVCPRASTEPAF